jgi:hypothetical protein
MIFTYPTICEEFPYEFVLLENFVDRPDYFEDFLKILTPTFNLEDCLLYDNSLLYSKTSDGIYVIKTSNIPEKKVVVIRTKHYMFHNKYVFRFKNKEDLTIFTLIF